MKCGAVGVSIPHAYLITKKFRTITTEKPKMLVIVFLAVLTIAPLRDCTKVFLCTDEEYYEQEKNDSPSCAPSKPESYAKKLETCKLVLGHEYFHGQTVRTLDPTNEEMYAELKRSNFYEKYQPDNTTLFENPYAQVKIVVRKNVLENFVLTTREHFLSDFAFTCLVQNTEKPHDIQPFFLSRERKFPDVGDDIGDRYRYVFVYNQRVEKVVFVMAQDIRLI